MEVRRRAKRRDKADFDKFKDENIKNLKPSKRIFLDKNWYSIKFAKTNPQILAAGDEGGIVYFYDVTKEPEPKVKHIFW